MSYGVTYYIFTNSDMFEQSICIKCIKKQLHITSVFQIFLLLFWQMETQILYLFFTEEDKKSGHFCFNSPYFLRTTINIFFFVEHVRLQIGKHSAGPPTGKRCVFKLDKSKRLTSGVVRQQKNHLFTKYRVINMDLSYSRQLLCVCVFCS